MEGVFGRHATNPRSAPSAQALREATRGVRTRIQRKACYSVSRDRVGACAIGSLIDFGASETSGRAYSSVGLERTPDKREVGGSNPPRPTTFRHPSLVWGCSSVGRAPALQAGCRRFDSDQLHSDFPGPRVLARRTCEEVAREARAL